MHFVENKILVCIFIDVPHVFQVLRALGLGWEVVEGSIHCGSPDSLETPLPKCDLLLQMSNYSLAVLKENASVTQVSVFVFSCFNDISCFVFWSFGILKSFNKLSYPCRNIENVPSFTSTNSIVFPGVNKQSAKKHQTSVFQSNPYKFPCGLSIYMAPGSVRTQHMIRGAAVILAFA